MRRMREVVVGVMVVGVVGVVGGLAARAGAQSIASGGGVRFVVGEHSTITHNDSYTLTLTSAADIAHARALIAGGLSAGAPILVANMAAGADGINRNWRASGAPAWTWRLTEFIGFADVTPEILDGWPTFIESDVPGWIANTQGQIGFWGYTVVGELPPVANPACPADFNGSGGLDVADIFAFLNAWLGGSPDANFNGENGLGVRDIFDFVNAWLGGC